MSVMPIVIKFSRTQLEKLSKFAPMEVDKEQIRTETVLIFQLGRFLIHTC